MNVFHKSTSTDTTVTTIGRAVIVQSIIRYGAIILLAWLALNFADAWIMAAIEVAK